MPSLDLRLTRKTRHERNAYRELVPVTWYELQCPRCGRSTGLSQRELEGVGMFRCPGAFCQFSITHDMRPWAKAVDDALTK